MKRLSIFFVVVMIITVFLTACWDQRLLRDHSLVLTIGYDKGENDNLKNTVSFPKNSNAAGGGQQNQSDTTSTTLSVIGTTVKDTERKMDMRIPEKFDRSIARVILFGESLASEGIFSTLDSVYRDLRGPLNAKVAIFDGEAEDALSIKSDQAPMVSAIYAELLESAGKAGITKNETVQIACPIMLSEGKDLVLPYVSLNKAKDEAVVNGTALFFHDKMTGTLGIKESTMFLILSDQMVRDIALNLKVDDGNEDPNKDFVNIIIQKNKRKVHFETDNEDVQANINLSLLVEIDEYASDQLSDEAKVKALSKKIEDKLNQLAKETVEKMQEANSDALGLGERVKAFHHDTWKKIDWIKEYPDIKIDVDFDVEIIRHGIIN